MKTRHMFFLLTILLHSCTKESNTISDDEMTIKVDSLTNVSMEKIEPEKLIPLKNFTEVDVAKFAISTIMFQPTKIISATKSENNHIISYTRRDDGKKFTYKVRIEGNKIIWANIDGRWRDSPEDEKITFIENGNKLKIIQQFSDGSKDEKEFKK
jgi:hypothetical protein